MDDKKIIVAYDGSPDSERALKLAASYAKLLSANLVLVSVIDVPHATQSIYDETGYLQSMYEPMKRKCAQMVQLGTGQAEALGVPVQGVVLEGSAPEEILKRAHEENACLIVVGSRGLGGFQRLLLGSTAQALVTYSDIPVLVAK